MRVKIWSTALYMSIMSWTFSCDNIEEDPIIRASDYYGDGSYFISLDKLEYPNIINTYCAEPIFFELRDNADLAGIGTVSMYSDGQFLNLQYNFNSTTVSEGWSFVRVRSYIWIGPAQDWIYGRDGPEGGWASIPDINREVFTSDLLSFVHQIKLEDWMFEDCIILGIRAGLDDQEQTRGAPKALLNKGDHLTYTWNESFCLEKCDDPGTQTAVYWENNPEIWSKGVIVGDIFYSEELAIQIMKGITTNDDISNVLFEELVSAKLNVDLGNTSYCIIEAIEEADTWMEENGPVGSGVLSSHPSWAPGNSLANQLESYNNGLMCADPAN